LAERLVDLRARYFVGRSAGYAVAWRVRSASRGQLLHAEAYSAAELKHGPLALISPATPTVAVIPRDDLYPKEPLDDRGNPRPPGAGLGRHSSRRLAHDGRCRVRRPASEPELDPILLNIPLQLLAYHVGLKRGCDIDKRATWRNR